MSSNLDRRDLLKLGVGGMAGLALPASVLAMQSEEAEQRRARRPQGTRDLSASYVVQPGVINRLEAEVGVTLSAPWAIPAAFADLSQELQTPVMPKIDDLMRWAEAPENEKGGIPFHGDLSLDEAIRLPILGGLPMTNLLSESLEAVLEGRELRLELTFDVASTAISRQRVDVAAGLPVIVPDGSPTPRPAPEAEQGPAVGEKAISVPVGSWRLTLYGPDFHPLGSCVTQSVKHYNLKIQRAIPNRPGRYQDVKNFHLGAYKSGSQRCFVLWNNVAPGVICWKKCSPKSSDLKFILTWALLVAAAAIGVYLAASVASAIAATATAVFFPILIVL